MTYFPDWAYHEGMEVPGVSKPTPASVARMVVCNDVDPVFGPDYPCLLMRHEDQPHSGRHEHLKNGSGCCWGGLPNRAGVD